MDLPKQPLTGARLLVDCLYRHGVRCVFGMPGSHSSYIYDALCQHGGIKTFLCRNEQTGAFMADGYARATGRPGVICTTAGPGATNALTGVAEAYADSVPVLLITGQVNHDRLHEECGRFHELDLEGIFRPCTRYAATVMSNQQILQLVDRAFEAMSAARPGPAALILPNDLMGTPAAEMAHPIAPVQWRRQPPDADLVQRAVDRLLASARPVILAGGGAVSSDAGATIEQLAHLLGCPVMTTANGKGIIDERSPLSLGHGRTRRARMALSRADAMLALGCRFTEIFTAGGSVRIPESLIQVDIDPRQIGMNYPVAVGIVADVRTTVEAMLAQLRDRPGVRKDQWQETWQRARNAEQLKPEWLIETLRKELPESTLFFADACELGVRMQTDFPVYAPRTYFYPSNFVTLGWGYPAAVGGAIARPDAWTVCLTGDGGFVMGLSEIATSVRYNLKLITVLHNDNAYSAIKLIQENRHESRYIDTDLNNPDFVQLARSFGVPSCRVNNANELASALRQATTRDGPTLIEFAEPRRPMFNTGKDVRMKDRDSGTSPRV
jgi:acetolactate synthase I/II/III large subunit